MNDLLESVFRVSSKMTVQRKVSKRERTRRAIITRHFAVETGAIEGRSADTARVLASLPFPASDSVELLHFNGETGLGSSLSRIDG